MKGLFILSCVWLLVISVVYYNEIGSLHDRIQRNDDYYRNWDKYQHERICELEIKLDQLKRR